MYEEYMQNFFGYPINNQYQNTYSKQYPYGVMNNQNMYWYPNQGCASCNTQNRGENYENIENYYPEIYKIIYPMVKKACSNNNRTVTQDVIESLTNEVYSNFETNNSVELNINLGNAVRGETSAEKTEVETKVENRSVGQNGIVNDLIRILIIRELIRRPGCTGPNCLGPRPGGFGVPPYQQGPNYMGNQPPFPRYDF